MRHWATYASSFQKDLQTGTDLRLGQVELIGHYLKFPSDLMMIYLYHFTKPLFIYLLHGTFFMRRKIHNFINMMLNSNFLCAWTVQHWLCNNSKLFSYCLLWCFLKKCFPVINFIHILQKILLITSNSVIKKTLLLHMHSYCKWWNANWDVCHFYNQFISVIYL